MTVTCLRDDGLTRAKGPQGAVDVRGEVREEDGKVEVAKEPGKETR